MCGDPFLLWTKFIHCVWSHIATSDNKKSKIAELLVERFTVRHGVPFTITTDNRNDHLLVQRYDTRHSRTSSYHPQRNDTNACQRTLKPETFTT